MQLTLEGLGHAFDGENWLFRGLDAALTSGRTYALTGPSGSGKSTLLSIMAGWLTPTEGRVVLESGAKISWVFQNPHGVSRRTALDHVALPFLARGARLADADRLSRELLEQFRLAPLSGSRFSDLSGGEAQRLMLARGVAADPDVLLIDEPTAQLDARTSRSVNEVISETARAGRVVVVATHDRGTRDACTDHIDLAGTALAENRRL